MNSGPDRPHILLVCVDHWPAAFLGSAGHPHAQTPTLDNLALDGARFARAYSECPVCIPARRTLLTGVSPRAHGDRSYQPRLPMPALPTLPRALAEHGYQCYAVGKLHVFPPRDRIGFHDALLNEEGRSIDGCIDDYSQFLADSGHPGAQFLHGMSNNEYVSRPWHLPERLHPTNWTAEQMARLIRRRDPTRPGFWYLSFNHPHPPLTPLACYLDAYERELPLPGENLPSWSDDPAARPASSCSRWTALDPREPHAARRAFYALCTHIDHQLRVVIGTLREEGLLNRTLIVFTSDHGDMLGRHGFWAKQMFYEESAGVPLVISPPAGDERLERGVSRRLVGLQDIMPTILDFARVPVPSSVEGESLLRPPRRSVLYGEMREDASASRMIHDGVFKLVYYPAGNRRQLFNLDEDPHETRDLSVEPAHRARLDGLTELLVAHLHGSDLAWIKDGRLVGAPSAALARSQPRRRALGGQRGLR